MPLERITTGVPGLDQAMSGGIPKGSTVLVAGPPGAGKTILANQIAYHRASQGERVLILTTSSEGVTKLLTSLEELEYFKPQLVGDVVRVQSVEALLGGGGLDALLQEIRRSAVESRVGLLVLDSLTSLYTSYQDPPTVRRFLSDLGSALFVLGCTAILVQGQYSIEQSLEEQTIADGVILMDVSVQGEHEERRLRISKMRGGKHLYGLHPYQLTQAGLSLHPHE
ncbi:MAG: AAA family ATPase [Chloroflexota bacterium]|nr:AAA family ATPase [Chloroflexota bacterium]